MQFLPSNSVCNFTKTEIRTHLTTKSLLKNSPQEFIINKLEPNFKKSLFLLFTKLNQDSSLKIETA